MLPVTCFSTRIYDISQIMTSNKQNNNMIPRNIKIEPGTSRFSENVNNIKLELGTSGRLTSLKLPRDLKLGGSKAKVFKPNLNVIRKKQTNASSPTLNNRGRSRGRGRGFDRGRGNLRGRLSNNFVQSQGVFSDGIADAMIKRPYETRENSVYDVTKVMDRPTINKNVEWKVDKEQEDLIMKDILSIHIEPDDPEAKNDLHPIFLPINKFLATDKPIKFEDNFIKTEEMPIENGINAEKLLESNEKLLLFQFPDTLPGIGAVTETEKDIIPQNSGNNSNNDKKSDTDKKTQTENKCTLHDVNEGLLGKIVVYKSGKKKLIIGNNRFDVEMGPNAGFLQDVMSVPVSTESKSGDMINLGSLDGNVIVTPEWNSLLYSE